MDKVLTEQLFMAYYEARKNKRNTANQLKFEVNFEHNLFELSREIERREYELQPSIAFMIDKPVRREIFAADFRDRVVHHLVSRCIYPLINKHLIHDSYSCRLGKGTGFGINRAKGFLRKCSHNYQQNAYILKLDVQSYFMSMQHRVLYQKVQSMLGNSQYFNGISRNTVDYLLQKIIFATPTYNCHIKGNKSDWKGFPKTKSLFNAPPNTGLPIGNLTSQIFGNVYLNDLDHYTKHQLKIKHYGRYVDDMLFVHNDLSYLKSIVPLIDKKLQEIGMQVHPKKIYLQHYTKGVLFLGQFIKPYRSYVSRRVKANFYAVVQWANKWLNSIQLLNWDILKTIQAKINSYVGICKQANAINLLRKLILQQLSENRNKYFDLENFCLKFKPKEQVEWHFTATCPFTRQHTIC